MAQFLTKNEYSTMSMPKAMNRSNASPLDASAVWTSLEELRQYAATSPVAYVGQILSLVAYEDEQITDVKAYIIKDTAGNIEEVGSATLGDNKTIELKDGVLSLANWGREYYKWVEANGDDPEAEGYVAGHHEKYTLAENEAWPAGLEPKAATSSDGVVTLAWYQPSTTTIEGVSSTINSIQNTVNELTKGIGSSEDEPGAATVYGTIKNYLPLAGGTLTGDLTLKDGGKAVSETQLAAAINSAGHLKRAIVEQLPEVEAADANTIYMIKTGLLGDKYTEWMLIDGTFEQIGDTTVDLTNYLQKAETSAEGNLISFAANGALVDANVAASDVAAHLADTDIHITTSERDSWKAAAEKVETLATITAIGDGLALEEGILSATYELPVATAEILGGVKVADQALAVAEDGTLTLSIAANANGLTKATDGLSLALASADNAGAMSAAAFSKLTAIQEGAQANVIEGALLDGVAASIEGKQLVFETATTSAAGLVYASKEDNAIDVDENGIMRLNRVSANKLYVPEDDELILSGGGANK